MLAVAQISAASTCDRYKLFDPDRLSDRTDGDWHQFLARYLTHKLAQVAPYLHRDAPRFAGKVQHLLAVLDQPYCGDEHLIHGDFSFARMRGSRTTGTKSLSLAPSTPKTILSRRPINYLHRSAPFAEKDVTCGYKPHLLTSINFISYLHQPTTHP